MKKRQIIFYFFLLVLACSFYFYQNGTMSKHMDEVKESLMVNANEDAKIKQVLENYNDYPIELLEMLSRNLDMIDYVVDYPKKIGHVYSDTIGEIEEGTFPLLLQYDSRWGYGYYGNKALAINGCGPTALSMVVAGLTNNLSITPYVIATYANEKGYYISGSGSSWNLMTEGSLNFGVKGTEIMLTKSLIFQYLKKGNPIICSMGPGDFTTAGHFIVLVGVEEGKIKVNDPNSKERSSKLWDYETLEPQIKNLWVFEKA